MLTQQYLSPNTGTVAALHSLRLTYDETPLMLRTLKSYSVITHPLSSGSVQLN